MKKSRIILLLLTFLIVVFVALLVFPFLRQKYADKDLHSAMLIGVTDLKGGYSLIEARPRTKNDIGDYSRELGWQGGYHALYKKTGYILPIQETVFLIQDNSIYPMENISKTLDYFKERLNYAVTGLSGEIWNFSVIKTPDEIKGIVDDIIVYEGSSSSNGKPLHAFSAYFIKGDVFQAITLSGDENAISMNELIDYVKMISNLTSQAQ
jgi:hypothetical protein